MEAEETSLPRGAVRRFECVGGGALKQLVLSPDGARLYAGSDTGAVGVWNIEAGRLIRASTAGEQDRRQAVAALRPGSDGDLRALSGNELLRWDATGRLDRTTLDVRSPSTCAFSQEGSRIAICGAEPPITLLDIATGATVRTLDATVSADQLAFSPDDAHLAGARLWRLCLWNAETGEEVWKRRLEGTVRGFTFSSDGTRVFADVDYEGIMILDTASGAILQTLSRPGTRRISAACDCRVAGRIAAGGDRAAWSDRRLGGVYRTPDPVAHRA